ncbi:MAG: PaaX family transcriptional regulator [Paracoccaceae bacterium]
MGQGKTAAYQDVLDGLLACGPVKTWSLIVTVLGDLAAEPGTRVAGPVLSLLTEPMGLKPEALRVAIHRLRRDGWVTSERDGRTSLYELTAHGRALTREAAARVYGTEVEAPGRWHVVVAQSAEAMQALDLPDMLQIGPRSALLPGEAEGLSDAVLAWEARAGAVPDWVKAALVPEDLAAAYAVLARALAAALALEPPAGPVERAVLRLLALHQWRRLVLRHGPAVEALMGPDWDGARCRAGAGALLQRLGRPDPAELAAMLP